MSDDNKSVSENAEDPTTENPVPVKKTGFVNAVKQFYTNPETRMNALLLSGIAIAMVSFGAYDLLGGNTQKVISSPGSARNVKNLPGGDAGGALYNQNLNALNQKRAAEAAQQNQTYVPTVGALHSIHKKAPPAKAPPTPPAAKAPPPSKAAAAPQQTAWQKTEAKDAQLELMRFINAPVPTPLTTSLRVSVTSGDNVPSSGDHSEAKSTQNKGPVLANPGHIAFGELLTSINSNEPGPVEAEIVSGRFNGAKVLGKFKREKDRLVIQFDTMTWNHQNYPISAYAINAKTARTYVATSVNHHTLARWGGLIAASFLGGVDNA